MYLHCESCNAREYLDKYNLSYLNMANGLPNNFVDDIFQDSKGFIWIATHGGGLVRYDGYTYLYLGQGNQGLQLKSNSCKNIMEDAFSRLWVSFEERTDIVDLNSMHSVIPECINDNLSEEVTRILKEQSIRSYRDSHNNMWLITMRRIYCFEFNADGKISAILSESYVSNTPDIAIEENSRGMLVCYGGTVHLLNNSKGRFIDKNLSAIYPFVRNLYITDMIHFKKHIWFATNTGLYCDTGKSYHHDKSGSTISHDFISALAVSPEGNLLIGTLNGVDCLLDNNKFVHWNTFSVRDPLCSNFVNCIFSKNGLVWVGTESGGITKLYPQQLAIQNFVHSDSEYSISPNAVNAMLIDPSGTLWIGTVEGGLNKLIPRYGFKHFTMANSGLSHNSVSALAVDSNRVLWIGTWGGGINILSASGKVSPLPVPEKYRSILSFIGSVTYDKRNNGVWIGSNEGLYFYDERTKELVEPFPECHNIRGCIGSIITRKGLLYVGCVDGMVVVDLKKRRHSGTPFQMNWKRYKLDNPQSGIIDKITCFCEDKNGTLWLGSNGYGLYRQVIDKSGNIRYQCYTQLDGLANNCVKGITQGSNGMLYITTDHGLSQFNPITTVFTNFYESDGLLSSQFYFNSAIHSPEGKLYLGCDRGLIEISGENTVPSYRGHLIFTGLQVDNQDIFADGKYLDKDISLADKINLQESDRSFTIEFSALNYGSETQGVYYYRMKGFEDNWIPLPSGQHSVRYTTLPAGSYQFQVKYTSNLMEGSDNIISIDVNVSPYFWKSWWFISIILFSLTILAGYLYKKRMQQVRNKEVEQLYRPIETALKVSENPRDLQHRIQDILHNEERYQESQTKTVEADKKEIQLHNLPFMDRVMKIMEENYDNSEFGVAELSEKIGLSRPVLSRKLSAEIGQPTTQFIRNYRLDIACKLLKENPGNRNVTEIAYHVGFNDPKYFTRCFKRRYGSSPSSIKA